MPQDDRPMAGPLGCSTLACPGWTLEQAADLASRLGYQGLELRLLDGELIQPGLSPAARQRVRGVLRGAGLELIAVDTSIRLLGEHSETEAGTNLQAFLELAAELEAPLVRVFGGIAPGGWDAGAALARAARILERAVPEAERLNVAVGIETHDAFSAAEAVAAVLSRVSSSRVGAIWDLLHTHRMGDAPARVVELFGGRTLAVHVKDARRAGDDRWQLVPLGEGEVPVPECLAALRVGGYTCPLVVEWEKHWHPEIEGPDVALPHEIRVLRGWL
jgi:sugar phosphate isomerase/epimerase